MIQVSLSGRTGIRISHQVKGPSLTKWQSCNRPSQSLSTAPLPTMAAPIQVPLSFTQSQTRKPGQKPTPYCAQENSEPHQGRRKIGLIHEGHGALATQTGSSKEAEPREPG